ncbi:MAG: type II secretion system protein GspG [Planctomycetes bacterium]|nr:type II secretion system protein GspG [Planctomycetota bacterium]
MSIESAQSPESPERATGAKPSTQATPTAVGDSRRTFVVLVAITFCLLLACVLGATWVFRTFELESRAKEAVDRARFENRKKLVRLDAAVKAFQTSTGRLPASIDELRGPDAARWFGGEPFDALYVDAWGETFRFERVEGGHRLGTLGRDGAPGGVGLDEDQTYP